MFERFTNSRKIRLRHIEGRFVKEICVNKPHIQELALHIDEGIRVVLSVIQGYEK